MKNLRLFTITGLLIGSMALSSCETPGQGAKHGAMIGAGIGALTEGNLRGALKGAAIGAASGAILGKLSSDSRRDRYDDRYDDRDYRSRDYADRRSGPRYPMARPTRYDGYVRSPYSPYHLIDVRGIPPGARVVDPSSERVFINP